MKKIEINENWEQVEVEDLSNIFVVLLKHGSFDQGYIEASDTDDVLMQNAYDNLVNQYNDCGCDELTKIYLIKVPNTNQTTELCNAGLFNGSSCDPHVIEATKDLFNRADCEPISCWTGCGLTESKKKKRNMFGAYMTITTGDPALNMKHFNKCMGTDGLGNASQQHAQVVGDTLPDGPIASEGSGESSGEASGGEGGAVGESLNEAKSKDLESQLRDILEIKDNGEKVWTAADHPEPHLFEVGEPKPGDNPWWIEKFDDDEVDFGNLTIYSRTPEEKEEGKYIATFMISGGKNGSGEWTEYLTELTKVFKEIKEKTGAEPLLYKLDTDICDDVWTGYVFVYDHDDKVQESLTEDLIVIEPEEAKAKMFELRDQIIAEKDPKVRKNLLVLMNVYLFQTFMGGMPRSSDEAKEVKAKGEDEMVHSDLTKAEWDELSEFHKEETEKEDMTENLTEAKLDYYEQVEKMRKLDNGTRGFNASSASDEKLKFNRRVCQEQGFTRALKIVEDEMIRRGLMKRQRPANINNIVIDTTNLTLERAKDVFDNRDNAEAIITKYDNLQELLMALLIALWMKKAELAGKIKDYIIETYTVTLDQLKAWLKENLASSVNQVALQAICYASGICTESLEEELLDEDKIWAERIGKYRELPNEIKILSQAEVEDFISTLEPEEEFKVGYVTPVYFYKELDDKFSLLKATELVGYTGLDYRDATGAEVEDHAERLANAKRQIDTYKNGAEGHQLNDEGERFSATYTQTNKLVKSPTRDLETTDDQGQAVVNTTDLNRILFYPKVGSKPKVIYYLDVFAGKGYEKVSREFLENILYKKVQELAFAKDNHITDEDRKIVQKWGFKDIIEFSQKLPGMTIADYKNAIKLGIKPEDYLKTFPFSRRWTMKMFSEKVKATLEQDASTIGTVALDATKGMNRDLTAAEAKPQVRALYSNQVYYLSGKAETFGHELKESLTEGIRFDPEMFEDVVLDSKVRDWYAGNNPYEFQLEDIPEDLTWKDVIEAINEGKYHELKVPSDTEPRENIWKKGCQIYYAKYGNLPEKDLDAKSYLSKLIADEETYDNVVDDEYLVDHEPEAPGCPEDAPVEIAVEEPVEEAVDLEEAKRYVKRYYVRPQNIFCSNKEDILKALLRVGDENCSIYSLKELSDHDDVHLLKPSDIIYYYDDGILYDKNHVKVMDYDLFVKHEEDRKKFADVDTAPSSTVNQEYDDRLTKDDLNDKEAVANFKAINEDTTVKNYTIETLKDALAKGAEVELGYNTDDADDAWSFSDGGVYASTEYSVSLNDSGKYEVSYYYTSDDGDTGNEGSEVYDTYEDFVSWLKGAHLEDCPILLVEELHEDAFNLDFQDRNVYGEALDDTYTCCICGEECHGYGNNPEPVKHEGRCCDACNRKFVIPARIAEFTNPTETDESLNENNELDKIADNFKKLGGVADKLADLKK